MTKRFGKIYWTAEDVRSVAQEMGVKVTERQAARLLAESEKLLAQAMTAAGNMVIEDALLLRRGAE